MSTACENAQLDILRWMMEQPSRSKILKYMYVAEWHGRMSFLSYAAVQGHVEAMQYLFDHGAVYKFGEALLLAIRNNHFDAVKWLLQYFPGTEKVPDYCVLVEAARHGRVDMLQYFQSLDHSAVPGFPPKPPRARRVRATRHWPHGITAAETNGYRKVDRDTSSYRLEWLPTDAMDEAAANGELEAVKWLHANRSEGCTKKAMDLAAANGQLDVIRWLHSNRGEGCSRNALACAASQNRTEVTQWLIINRQKGSTATVMNSAASQGNLSLVQWLHRTEHVKCTAETINAAAAKGHFEVLKWVFANRPKRISLSLCASGLESAVNHGHLRIACWLRLHLPPFATENSEIVLIERNSSVFDMMLFLHTYYPDVISPGYLEFQRDFLSSKYFNAHLPAGRFVLDWFTENSGTRRP